MAFNPFASVDLEDDGGGDRDEGGDVAEVVSLDRWGAKKGTARKDLFLPGTDPDELFELATFYTRATNAHDHSATLRTRIHPEVMAAINRYIRRDTNPYESAGSFVRDWSVKGLYLATRAETGHPDPIAQRELDQYRVDEQVLSREMDEKYLDTVQDLIAKVVSDGDTETLALVLANVEQSIPTRGVRVADALAQLIKMHEWRLHET